MSRPFEYADCVHAPNDGSDIWPPQCGSASASRNRNDEQPIARTLDEFNSLPETDQCWECRSIVA